jgi:hypothetical protein
VTTVAVGALDILILAAVVVHDFGIGICGDFVGRPVTVRTKIDSCCACSTDIRLQQIPFRTGKPVKDCAGAVIKGSAV